MLSRACAGETASCRTAWISSDTAGHSIRPGVFAVPGLEGPILCNTQDNWTHSKHMRSSKNRSRSKGNRNRSVGNIVNRVFDSSGPEGKVRGTPQQIIDKYNQLARDAQLGNDRVAAENFQQHAEHYLRLLGEAQREMDSRRDQQEGGPQGGQQQGGQQGGHQPQHGQQNRPQQGGGQDDGGRSRAEAEGDAPSAARGFDAVIDTSDDGESTLVETPESNPKPKRSRTRRPRKPDAASGEGGQDGEQARDQDGGDKGGDDSSREAAE
jgi:hypothetical protein